MSHCVSNHCVDPLCACIGPWGIVLLLFHCMFHALCYIGVGSFILVLSQAVLHSLVPLCSPLLLGGILRVCRVFGEALRANVNIEGSLFGVGCCLVDLGGPRGCVGGFVCPSVELFLFEGNFGTSH